MEKVLKKLEVSSGRLNIPNNLLKFVGIKPNEKVAICKSEGCVKVKTLDSLKDCEVIAITKMDSKGRFVYPKYLLGKEKELLFEIYVLNGNLTLREL